MKRGEVWLTDFEDRGDSRQSGVRPAIIVQGERLNAVERYTLTIVIPCTTRGSEAVPSHALIAPTRGNGLTGTA